MHRPPFHRRHQAAPRPARRWAAALAALATVAGLAAAAPASAATAPPAKTFTAPIESWPIPWTSEKGCDSTVKPGPGKLTDLIAKTWGSFGGFLTDRTCSASSESGHDDYRAVDWMATSRNATSKAAAESFISWLISPDAQGNTAGMARRLGVMYVIWNNRMWRPYAHNSHPAGSWEYYLSCGSSSWASTTYDTTCHRNHVHVSLTPDGSWARTSYWSGTTQSGSKTAAPAAPSRLVPVDPVRILDTRSGTTSNPVATAIPPAGTLTVKVAGVSGSPVPAGATGVVVNVTVTRPQSGGWVALSPTGSGGTSTINFAPGQTVANSTVTELASDGTLVVRLGSPGAAHVVLDVQGYLQSASAGNYHQLAPVRVLDTRHGSAVDPRTTAVKPWETVVVPLAGAAGSPVPSGATAVALRATVTEPTAGGHLTAAPTASDRTSSLNFLAGDTVANWTTTALSSQGAVALTNNSAATLQLVLDVSGYLTATDCGTRLTATSPVRLADTRYGAEANAVTGALAPHGTLKLKVAGVAGSPVPAGARSAVLNVTATASTSSGWALAAAAVPDGTSTVNFTPGRSVAQLAVSDVAADGTVSVYNGSPGTVQVVVDVLGYSP